jgi:hypothetical protein
MAGEKLACPHCGATDYLFSVEETTIEFSAEFTREKDGSVHMDYTGESTHVNDEGTSYDQNIYCRNCCVELRESELISPAIVAHREPHVTTIEETSDRGTDLAWAAFCEASLGNYACDWASPWEHADMYVDMAARHNADADLEDPNNWTDPGQLAYEAAEAAGKEHLKQFGVDDDSVDATSSEDASRGTVDESAQDPAPAGPASSGS